MYVWFLPTYPKTDAGDECIAGIEIAALALSGHFCAANFFCSGYPNAYGAIGGNPFNQAVPYGCITVALQPVATLSWQFEMEHTSSLTTTVSVPLPPSPHLNGVAILIKS